MRSRFSYHERMPSTQDPRAEAIEWKKRSLGEIRELVGALKEAVKQVDKLCSVTKTATGRICRSADKAARRYEQILDEESDNYEANANAMTALQDVPSADEQAEDAKTQAVEALEGLISHLEEVKEAVAAVDL
jgi:hypothetical protein